MTDYRKTRPAPKKEISFSLPEIQKFKLENGLEVYFVKKDNLPMLQLNLVINAGSKFDFNRKKGTSGLLAMMIDEGAGNYDAMELSDEFDTIGANFSVSRNNDNIFLSLRCLKDKFDKGLNLFSSVITKPHFKKDDFERERRKALTKLLQAKDEPDDIANNVIDYLVFKKDNPYAYPVLGYENDIRELNINDIKNAYNELFVTNNSVLIAVGNIEKDILEKKLNSNLKNWQSGKLNELNFPKRTDEKTTIFLVNKNNAPQSEIRISHKTKNRKEYDYFSKTLLNTILGGQFSSRINLNLREDKGYTYGAVSHFAHYQDDAKFIVATSVGAENTAASVNEIYNELVKIKDGVLPEELAFAQSSLIRKFPSSFETYSQVATNLAGKAIHSLPDDYFNNYIDNIKSININNVNQAAKDLIHPDKLTIVIVGDKNKLMDNLKDLKLGLIIEVDLNGKHINT